MRAEAALSEVVPLILRLVHLRGMHPVMRSIMDVDAIIAMSGLWVGDINVPIVLQSPSHSISQVVLL